MQTAQILDDVANMVAALPAPKRFVVLGVTTADFPEEYVGQSGYNLIIAVNEALRSAYPGNFIDIRSFLLTQYDPRNPQDVRDQANGIPPSSLRSDQIHLSPRGYALVAQRVARFILGARTP
jgi:lysophospholipase L1-like esterase